MRAPALASQAGSEALEADEGTGRYIIHFVPDRVREGLQVLGDVGLRIASMAESDSGVLRGDEAGDADVLVLPNMAAAILSGEGDQFELVRSLAQESQPDSPIWSVEAEQRVQFPFEPGTSEEIEELEAEVRREESAVLGPGVAPTVEWGLGASGVDRSTRTGHGIRVAILDTGLDRDHPDFVNRVDPNNLASFVFGIPSPLDRNGHGTHSAGLACGPINPARPPRYGVAHGAEIFIGRVLNNLGLGATGEILAGIDWAVAHRCEVILLALEIPVKPNQAFNPQFEAKGSLALQRGSLIIAAVGNGSNRPASIAPVSEPANCPSIFGVGAAAPPDGLLRQSNGALQFPGAGTVDLVAPGARIRSSDLRHRLYTIRDGTSQAAALTAGIAALYAEVDATIRGGRLMQILRQRAFNLGLPASDGGAGLVQAP
jgi:subtilisin family serine protease